MTHSPLSGDDDDDAKKLRTSMEQGDFSFLTPELISMRPPNPVGVATTTATSAALSLSTVNPPEIDRFQDEPCSICGKRGRSFWFRLRPESAQALAKQKMTKEFRDKIRSHALEKYLRNHEKNNPSEPWNVVDGVHREVCVRLWFGLASKNEEKDVDNMAKALLDAIKDEKEEKYGLISEDTFVQHIQVEKHRLHVPAGGLRPESNFLIGVVISVLPVVAPLTYQLADPKSFPVI